MPPATAIPLRAGSRPGRRPAGRLPPRDPASAWRRVPVASVAMPRPKLVTLLAIAMLALGAINGLGVWAGLRRYTWVSRLPLSLPPAWLIATSAVWAVVFVVLAVGLWRLREWARRGTLLALPLYLGLGWVERLAFGRSDFVRVTVPCDAALHLLGLVLVGAILLARRVRRTFSG